MNFMQPQNQFTQPQQQQYDFSGWGDRLNKIEQGIAGLTDQFNSFQNPGDVAPEYTGNAAPEPLEQTTNAPEPLGGIESLAPTQNTGFNFDPSGGSLMSQLSSAYGGQTHNEQIGRGPAGFTQGFADFFTGEGYYADPRGTFADGPWSISETPITLGSKMGGTLDPYGNPQGAMQDLQPGIPQTDANWHPPQQQIELANTRPNDMAMPIGGLTQPQQQQALQGGLGALQGPTQQKIQQGYQV